MKKFFVLLAALFLALPAQAQYFPPGGGGGGSGTVTSVVAGTGLTGGTITTSGTVAASTNTRTRSVGAIFNGGSSTPTAGQTVFVYVPYSGTITAATLIADQTGSAVVDVWKVARTSVPGTVANTITASDLPTLSSAVQETDTTLTGWTTSVSAGDVVYFHLNSASTVTNLNVVLTVVTN
jgi:hypothetical protein